MKKKARKKTQAPVAIIAPEPVSFFNWPGTMDRVCARICSGGTLVDFCKEFNQHYQSVVGWIEENESRRKRYSEALRVREHHLREAIYRDVIQLRELDPTAWTYETGAMKPLHEIPESARRWISKIKTMDYYEGAGNHRIRVGELLEVTMFDKLKAIDMLTKLLGMIQETKAGAAGVKTLEEILAESRQGGEPMTVETVTATRVTVGARQ